ncbi:MAG: hypothetical protein ACR2NL_11115, partial [Acidimicrobiia bacterium]
MRRFGWVTLEETENDPVLLWRYIVFALQALAPGLAAHASSLLNSPQPDLEAVAAEVVNGLVATPGRLVLVLDDYHVIKNPSCHQSIQRLLDHLPESAQVAFGTRVRPPLSLTGLSARGLLLKIDASSLSFTTEETRAALERSSDRVTAEQAADIQSATEGWPVGVFLSNTTAELGSGQGSTHRGRRAVGHYLMEQMLDQLPKEELETLADWSILRRFNGSLADRVARRRNSASLLGELSDRNLLLVALDEQGDWYRLHDLLRDELQQVFEGQSEEHQIEAHARATDWWLENGNESEAIHHALASGRYRRAGDLISISWAEYLLTGQHATLRMWLRQFPRGALLDDPPLLLAAAWTYAWSGDAENTHRYEQAARAATYEKDMPDGTASYASALAMLRATLGQHGMIDANEQAELAYELEPAESPWKPQAALLAGITRFGLGQYADAESVMIEAATNPTSLEGVVVYARGQLALLHMSQGDWNAAEREAEFACNMIDQLHAESLLTSGAAQVAAAAVAAHAGKRGLATQRLNSFARVLRVLSDAIPFDAFQLHLIAAETELAIDNRNAAHVHARAASAHLQAFGDAGIFEERYEVLLSALGPDGEEQELTSDSPQLTDRELQI